MLFRKHSSGFSVTARYGAKMRQQPGYLRFAEMQRSTFAEERDE